MNKICAIAKKELYSYFRSPIAYIVLIVTTAVFNIFFFMIIEESREALLRDVFRIMEFMFVFIVPLLTMKVFAEEKQNGTMEFLMTTPTSNTSIVLGKYLGSLCFLTLIIAFTSIYYVIIEYFADPDRAAVFTGYLGIWLEGAFFIAVGCLTSSWTRNQIVAAITSYVVLFLLYFSIGFTKFVSGSLETAVRFICTLTHSENFSSGIFAVSDIVYYLSGILLCITLTRLSIENRLWR